ncbi:hypothetical protein HPB50_019641 [Hyalomma asiaticum]|uniref:Uncharacterized protein n=1 Tax=Hyalomma asiaticum TaxID=266040 RepID=A0ACB7RVW5_HYAAI|nr:hypothetical protein HPB50_019641 [Hyalomma asiaticum]
MGLLLAVGLFGALALRVCQDPDEPTVAAARGLRRDIRAYEALVEDVRSCYFAQATVPSALDAESVLDLTTASGGERADRKLVSHVSAQLVEDHQRTDGRSA